MRIKKLQARSEAFEREKREMARIRVIRMRDRRKHELLQHHDQDAGELEVLTEADDMMDVAIPLVETTRTSISNVLETSCPCVNSLSTQPLSDNDAFVGKILIPPTVTVAYKCIHQATGKLGGNGATGPIYGEITVGSMQHIFNFMKQECGFTADSRFIDVGSGLGKPNFHAAQDPGVRLSIGVELERIRHQVGTLPTSSYPRCQSDMFVCRMFFSACRLHSL